MTIRFDYGFDLVIINFIWPTWTLLIFEIFGTRRSFLALMFTFVWYRKFILFIIFQITLHTVITITDVTLSSWFMALNGLITPFFGVESKSDRRIALAHIRIWRYPLTLKLFQLLKLIKVYSHSLNYSLLCPRVSANKFIIVETDFIDLVSSTGWSMAFKTLIFHIL